MFRRYSLPASFALLALLTAPASAQQDTSRTPPPAPMGGMMGMRGQMPGMMGMRAQASGMMMRGAHGMHPMMDGTMRDVMRVHMYSPKSLLNHKDVLELTQAQVDRLSQLDSDATKAIDEARASHQDHLKQLRDALDAAQADPKAVKAQFDATHAAMGSLEWAALNAALSAKAVLTDVQRARVQGWADAMPHRMMGAGPRGMMHRSMPRAPGAGGPGAAMPGGQH